MNIVNIVLLSIGTLVGVVGMVLLVAGAAAAALLDNDSSVGPVA